MTDIISAYKGDSNGFFADIPDDFKCRLAFVDGDHSYEAVSNDIEIISKHLVPGGWICFDDAFSSYEGVNRAITDHVINNSGFENCQQLARKFFVARKKTPSI